MSKKSDHFKRPTDGAGRCRLHGDGCVVNDEIQADRRASNSSTKRQRDKREWKRVAEEEVDTLD